MSFRVELSEAVDCVVPARISSTRFPKKPLALIHGVPMIVRVLQRVKQAECFHRIYCATDDEQIADLVHNAGFTPILTFGEYATGSDRVAAVAKRENLQKLVNVQGDEPLVGFEILRKITKRLQEGFAGWVTAAAPLENRDVENRDVVKLQLNSEGEVKLFARKIDASERENWFRHRGIYGYNFDVLNRFASLKQSALETEESLEQMRVFSDEKFIAEMDYDLSWSVDRPEDILKVEQILREYPQYEIKEENVCY